MEKKSQPTKETPSVKESLKKAREAQKISLDEVARKLRISKSYLRALENDDESLTCDVYTLGFLRSYATFLGLNADKMCKDLKEKGIQPSAPQVSFPAPLPGKGMPSRKILVLSFCVLLAVVIGWEWLGNLNPPAMEAPLLLEKEKILAEIPEIVPTPVAEVIPVENAAIPAKAAPFQEEPIPAVLVQEKSVIPASDSVILKTSEEAWIEVKDKEGNVVVSRLFSPSESYEFKDATHLLLKTGNARGTQLVSGDKTLTLQGSNGSVQSNIPLDPEKWVEQIAETQ